MSLLQEYYKCKNGSKAQYEKLLKKLSRQTTSREFFTLSNGGFEPKRKKLHDDIIDKYLAKYPSQEKPYIHLILGSIGSGKTSVKDSVIRAREVRSFLYINFDELKRQLPEYKILQKLNPEKAAQFVQSESAKLAGTLFKKAVQKKKNIIYEKNLRLGQNKKLHAIEEIKRAFKKKYILSVHVVFLNSHQEAQKRAWLRYKRNKRYVSQQEVKDTFQCLFPNLNRLLSENFKEEYSVKFWYNGKWNIDSEAPKEAHAIGMLSFQNKRGVETKFTEDELAVIFQGDAGYRYYAGFLLRKILFLPDPAKKALFQLKYLKTPLKVWGYKKFDVLYL